MRQNTPFKIYIDRLKDDDTEQIYEVIDNALFDIAEKELQLTGKVTVSGQAYLAKNHLILELKVKAKALLPCSICNKPTEVPLVVEDFNHIQEICEIKSAVWDYTDEVRNAFLLKVPQFTECHDGKCPGRKEITKYLAEDSPPLHTPFSGLETENFEN